MITITTINKSYYFINNTVIQPDSSLQVDESVLSYRKLRDLKKAEESKRISLSAGDKILVENGIASKDNNLSPSEFKTVFGESIVGSGNIEGGTVSEEDTSLSDLGSSVHISGGNITPTGGVSFTVSSGVGYARDSTDKLIKIIWDDLSGSALYSEDNYISIDYTGSLVLNNSAATSTGVPIGYIYTGSSNTIILGYANSRLTGKNSLARIADLFRGTLGSLVESGCSTAMKPSPDGLELIISEGKVWSLLNKYNLPEKSTFYKLYKNSVSFAFDDSVPNKVNNTQWNNTSLSGSSALVTMTSGYYKKDMIAITPTGTAYYLFGTTEVATLEEAREIPLPLVPENIKTSVIRSAALIIQKDALEVSTVLDIRPVFQRIFETGAAASNATVISHNDLVDLSDDTHQQYLNETRADIRFYKKADIDNLLLLKSNSDHTHPLVTTSADGLLSSSDKVKLNSVQNNATQNSTDAHLLSRTNHTGTQTVSTISDFTSSVVSQISNRIQDQIQDGNTLNAPSQNAVFDALATKAGTTHTHSIADTPGLQSTLDGKAPTSHLHTASQVSDFSAAARTAVVVDSVVDGVTDRSPSQNAVFDALTTKAETIHSHTSASITDFTSSVDSRITTKIASTVLDDLSDVNTTGKANGQVLTYSSASGLFTPVTPATHGDMYKTTYDTNNTGVVDDSEKLGNNLPTYFTNRSNHTGTQDVSTITGLSKTTIGLGNVDNTSDVSKPISTATQTALNTKENTLPVGSSTDYLAGDKTLKQLVTNNVTESTDKRYLTDAQKAVVVGISGTNTGDETTSSIKTKLGVASTTVDGYLSSSAYNTFNSKEPALPTGTGTQYIKGDKTLGTLDKAAVGLENVANTDTSNAANITTGLLPIERLSTNLQELNVYTPLPGSFPYFDGSNYVAKSFISPYETIGLVHNGGNLELDVRRPMHPTSPYFSFLENFVGVTSTAVSPYLNRTVTGGATSAVLPNLGDFRHGVVSLNTGTTTTGSATLSTVLMQVLNFANVPVGGYCEVGCSFLLPIVYDATNAYSLYLGFGDQTLALPTDGAYFCYTGGAVTARVVNNSTVTSTTFPGLANLVANTQYNLRIKVTRITSTTYSAVFTINGGFSTTVTTGFPVVLGRETALQFTILKAAGTVARTIEMDWVYYEHYYPRTVLY